MTIERDALFWQRLHALWESDPEGDVPGEEIWTLIEAYNDGTEVPPEDLKAEFERRTRPTPT